MSGVTPFGDSCPSLSRYALMLALKSLEQGKTSGEGRAEIVIAVIRVVTVHVRAVGISIADVHKVSVGIANFPYLLAVCGINGTKRAVTRLAPFA